jgi:hypothetical protein
LNLPCTLLPLSLGLNFVFSLIMTRIILFISSIILLYACRTGTGLFGKKTPHEQYGDKLSSAGLQETALGRAWFEAANRSLSNPLSITIRIKRPAILRQTVRRQQGYASRQREARS